MSRSQSRIRRYKYLPLDEGAKKVLTEGTIKFTSPIHFNDPFDCRPRIEPESIETIHKTRPDLYFAATKQAGLSPAERITKRPKIVQALRDAINSGSYYSDLLSGVGVVSLSRDPLNILMWSHYADFHRGFVVEFEIPLESRTTVKPGPLDLLVPHEVQYTDIRPTIRLGYRHQRDDLVRGFLTKASVWSYEQEERVIGYDRPPGIFPYARDTIVKSVVAGAKMSEESLVELRHIIDELNSVNGREIQFHQANTHAAEFKLSVPGRPDLGADPPDETEFSESSF